MNVEIFRSIIKCSVASLALHKIRKEKKNPASDIQIGREFLGRAIAGAGDRKAGSGCQLWGGLACDSVCESVLQDEGTTSEAVLDPLLLHLSSLAATT